MRWMSWAMGVGLGAAGLAGCPTTTDCADPRNAETCGKEKVELSVTMSSSIARVRPGESVELTGTIERKGEWPTDRRVVLSVRDLVSGVTMDPIELAADVTEVSVSFVAQATAPQGVFPCALDVAPSDSRIEPVEIAIDVVVPGEPGALDVSLDGDGTIKFEKPSTYYRAGGLAIDDRRRIMLAGYEDPDGAVDDESPFLLRLDGHGAVDTDFSQNVASVASDRPWTHYADVLWTEEGIVILAWQRAPDLITDMTLLRLDDTGLLDSGFVQDKVQPVAASKRYFSYEHEGPFLRLMPQDSTLWVFGSSHLLQYSNDGELNGEFGENGVLPLPPLDIYLPILLPNEELVWIGRPPDEGEDIPPSAWIVKKTKHEQLPDSYLADLLSGEELISGQIAKVNDCAWRSATNRLCVGFFSDPLPGYGAFIVSLDADWNLDPAFGTGGFVLRFPDEDVPQTTNVAITLVADKKFIVHHRGETPPALARYNPDGSPDVSFGDEGKVALEGGDYFYDARYEQVVVLRNDNGTIHVSRYWL